MRPLIKVLSIALSLALACAGATGQTSAWPTKAVRVLVPYPPGGVGDGIARAMTTRLANKLGQSFVIENVPGGNQIPASGMLSRAAPDGHTLLLVSPTSMVLNPLTRNSLPYDPDRLTLISRVASSPFFLITDPKLPANSVMELIALARAKPKAINYGSIGEGSSPHLASELLAQMTGVQMTHIPYKGTAQTNVDLMNGAIQFVFFPGVGSMPLVQDGRLKLLAVTSVQRSLAAPNTPTMMEAGLPNFVVEAWFGLAGPDGMPTALTQQISAAVREVLADTTLNQQFASQAVSYAGSTPEQFSAFYEREKKLWGPLVRNLNIPKE